MNNRILAIFSKYFFAYREERGLVTIEDKTISNYLVLVISILGFISIYYNHLVISVVIFLLVFVVMNIKSSIYYIIFNNYHKNNYEMEEYGSKYSFKYPKTVEIAKQ